MLTLSTLARMDTSISPVIRGIPASNRPSASTSASIALRARGAGPSYADLHAGVQGMRATAIARLVSLIRQLLADRLPPERSHESAELCSEVVSCIVARMRRGELTTAESLLDAVDHEANLLGLSKRCGLSARRRIDDLAGLFPLLSVRERRVLEGLYLEATSPSQLAAELRVSEAEIDETRRLALRNLRTRLGSRAAAPMG